MFSWNAHSMATSRGPRANPLTVPAALAVAWVRSLAKSKLVCWLVTSMRLGHASRKTSAQRSAKPRSRKTQPTSESAATKIAPVSAFALYGGIVKKPFWGKRVALPSEARPRFGYRRSRTKYRRDSELHHIGHGAADLSNAQS